MNNYNFDGLIRINKTIAKQIYNLGFDVLFIPCKCNPTNNYFNMGIWENRFLSGQYGDFETLYDYFAWYNCNSETGNYIAFYIRDNSGYSMHFNFENGSNPYIVNPNSILGLLEIYKKWKKTFFIKADDFMLFDNKYTETVFYTLTDK